MMTSTTQVELA